LKHTNFAEKESNHKLSDKFPKETPIPDLKRPDFGEMDNDIAAT